jgi:hypothetical protein
MTLKRGQRLKKGVECPFSILGVASAGSERFDESPLALDNPTGLGNITSRRSELIVGGIVRAHIYEFLPIDSNCR